MEGLNFLKFWKPTTTFPTPLIEVDNEEEEEEEEEEDSFFDLELTAPDFDTKKNDTKINEKDYCPDDKTTKESKILDRNEEQTKPVYPKPSLSLSPKDPIPKRKILPLEPIPKPQSPIAFLKSAPTFRAFSFKKSKSTGMTRKTGETTAKFVVEESPKLTRETSSRSTTGTVDSKTERFSKDVLSKYLKLVKPLYVKVSKRYGGEKTNNSHSSSAAEFFVGSLPSPSSSPASMTSPKDRPAGNIPNGIRVVCKHLGKSKSSSVSGVSQTTSNRRDDSLLQQHDGIQGAILHCKRSFNSSRDSFSLSRSTSDSSSMSRKSCSTDSYRLSNSASETSHDSSARNSIEDYRGICI